jgi:hypothetical protein
MPAALNAIDEIGTFLKARIATVIESPEAEALALEPDN